MENGLTELQADLPTRMLSRDLKTVELMVDKCFPNGLVGAIDDRMSCTEECTVVDMACGIGNAIEEIARVGHLLISDFVCGHIHGIGIDLNPRPDLLPEELLSINPTTTPPMAEFRRDDVRRLDTIASSSVDVLYSVGGLCYTPDSLRALESAFRVLKENGVMGLEVPLWLMTEPHISEIIGRTKGAPDTFAFPAQPTSDYEDKFCLIAGTKKRGTTFQGFPWRMVSTKPIPHEGKARYKHAITSIYEPILSDPRLI